MEISDVQVGNRSISVGEANQLYHGEKVPGIKRYGQWINPKVDLPEIGEHVLSWLGDGFVDIKVESQRDIDYFTNNGYWWMRVAGP